MEEKKTIWDHNPLRTFFGFGNIYRNLFWKKHFSSLISHFSFLNKGFTLIELLVAVAIIGVLAGSLLFALNPGAQLAKTRDAQRKSDFEQIQNALDIYYNDNNLYPLSSAGNKIMIGGSEIDWGLPWPPYIIKLPKDPLSGQDYSYESSDGSSYRLYAKLERCSDSQSAIGVDCLREYSYSINSSNLAALIPIPTPTPTPTPLPKRVFITSITYNGNLGGLSGADNKCQNLADGAGLSGSWKAWLSSDTESASSRLAHATVPYNLVDGTTLIANDWGDLTDGLLANRIAKDQNGNSRSDVDVWTNTTHIGDVASDRSCSNWVNGSSSGRARVGRNSNTSSHWTNRTNMGCDLSGYLYCFEQ